MSVEGICSIRNTDPLCSLPGRLSLGGMTISGDSKIRVLLGEALGRGPLLLKTSLAEMPLLLLL